ncbi:MAG: hypothetical protein A2381_15730 [Bdellovibrionales bacterium RIFOXYB1_FULL_37_110]|nr:MAG: hypothetical protein A2417_07580 [Bdellovibrionales bacterium RIFOXYC1_FULL_37_79]OFZ57065.1 MAG: hypothetical protein A2381_15730 [Bdellovibrionales bacterium RIFOXYB1_FULL_37_110]OFZ62084.1 MAG: hypothetical protein A2577_08500 [Bdellovibrionales bacterium RIFOXYD1_FULL_36_51]
MISDHLAILELTYCLIAAVTLVPLFNKLGLGSVLGYLFAGILLGPWGFQFVTQNDSVIALSDIGIIFLFFVIGLEISPQRLIALRDKIFIHGASQVFITTALLTLGLYLYKFSIHQSLLIGFALAISSTAYALNFLKDSNDIAHNYGQISMGILLFQDIIVIPMLLVIPLMSPTFSGSVVLSWSGILQSLGLFALVSFVGVKLLKKFIGYIYKTQSSEIFMASCLLIVLATATVMKQIGFSTGLGAFMAGVFLANSEVKLEIKKTILPFKSMLMGLFFIKIGMGLNFAIVFEFLGKMLLFTSFLISVKFAILYWIAKSHQEERIKCIKVGVLLSEAGEFSFIILAAAFHNKILMETTYEFLLTTVTMSMFVAPILFRVVKHFEKEKTLAVSGNVVSIDSLKTEKPIVADLKPSAIIDQAA